MSDNFSAIPLIRTAKAVLFQCCQISRISSNSMEYITIPTS